MSDEGPEQRFSLNCCGRAAFDQLRKNVQVVAMHSAATQSLLRALDTALEALDPVGRNAYVYLRLTEDEVFSLYATCHRFADDLPANDSCRSPVIALREIIFDSVCAQKPAVAQEICRLTGRPDPFVRKVSRRKPDRAWQALRKLPKCDRPYLRYTVPQMLAACAASELGTCYDHSTTGHARLHLSRDALVEMYRKPRRLDLVYAYLLRKTDQHHYQHIFPRSPRRRGPGSARSTLKPYENHSDRELRNGLKLLNVAPSAMRFAFGYLSVRFKRAGLLHLYRAGSGQVGIACLLPVYGEQPSHP